jgi:hypothetical protein
MNVDLGCISSKLATTVNSSLSYANPSWISSLQWGKLLSVPSSWPGTWQTYSPTSFLGLHAKADTAGAADTATTAAGLSGTPDLPNGTTATTQTNGDNSTQVATTAYVANTAAGRVPYTGATTNVDIGNHNFVSAGHTFRSVASPTCFNTLEGTAYYTSNGGAPGVYRMCRIEADGTFALHMVAFTDMFGSASTHAATDFQTAITNYSTISGLTGYPSTFPPTTSGDWGGTWQTHAPSYFQTALGYTPEPAITAGTSGQYWRGDKTWQTFPSIPAAQVQTDWNASSGIGVLLNKPTLGTASTHAATEFQAALGYTAESTANKGQANGYAGLGSDGKVPSGQLPTASSTASTATPPSFLLGASPDFVGETSNWKWLAPQAGTITSCTIDAIVYPTGTGSLSVNLLKNPTVGWSNGSITLTGGTSIFSSTVLVLPSGGTSPVTQTGMAAGASFVAGDNIMPKVTVIGGTLPGQRTSISCIVQ